MFQPAPNGAPLPLMPQRGILALSPPPVVPAYVTDEAATTINQGINSVGRPSDPQTQPKKPHGFLARLRAQPGGNDALLAFGAQMFMAPSLQQGLGQGIQAYQATLADAREKAKPKVDELGQGEYLRVTDPATGKTTYEETPFAEHQLAVATGVQQSKEKIARLSQDGQNERAEMSQQGQNERQEAEWTARADIEELRRQTDRDIAAMQAASRVQAAQIVATARRTGRPIPPSVTNQITELTDVRNELGNTLTNMAPVLDAIKTGKLSFSLASNVRHKLALATGVGGNDETVLYSQYNTMLEGLRNALLIANKGVQTDGDAERAMAQLVAGNGSTAAIQNNLNVVYRSLRRRMGQADGRIRDVADQYGANVSNTSPQAPASQPASPIKWRRVN